MNQTFEADPDWDDVRALANRLKAGKPLTLTARVLTVLRRSGEEVAIPQRAVEAALTSVGRATVLLRKIRTRIRVGSRRLGRALHQMYILRDAGDLEGARQQMRNVLAVEVVPYYLKIAQSQLDQLDDWKPPRDKASARQAGPAGKAPARKASGKAPGRTAAPPSKAPVRKASGKAPARNRRTEVVP